MVLADKKCEACKGEVAALDKGEIQEYLKQVNGWDVSEQYTRIYKEFKFRNFGGSLDFVNKVALIAEQEHHHPDINFGWGYCTVYIQTHAINGLHENDFILASKIDNINF